MGRKLLLKLNELRLKDRTADLLNEERLLEML